MNKKCLLGIAIAVASLSALTGCNGAVSGTCDHNYVETKVNATCTTEGFSNFTCSKCGDSYKGDIVIPLINHSGIGKCSVCNVKFDTIWKDFISKNGKDNIISFDGDIGVIISYTDTYDCMLYAITSDDGKDERTLTLGYNAYDQKWTWLFDFFNELGTAGGSFSQWSSRSNSLNCTYKTGYITAIYTDSELLAEVKRIYNVIIGNTNTKLSELGYNITMANFGLEN